MTYKYCEQVIRNKMYDSVDEMLDMLDVFLLGKRLSKKEYEELVKQLEEN